MPPIFPLPNLTTLQPSQLPTLSRDLLIEQLNTVLKRLEPLSQNPPQVLQEKALWFHPHEYAHVNDIWKRDGIDAVVSRYGDTRTFASGMPVSPNTAPGSVAKDAPQDAIVLVICEFGPNAKPDPAQQDYFRSSHISFPEHIRSEVLEAFHHSGLLVRLLPKVDDLTEVTLEGSPITDAWSATEWYGPNNYYGDGNTLVFTLTLSPLGHASELLILSIDKSGEMQRRLWCDEFAETGYEGHAHATSPLTDDELRAIIPIVAKIAELPPQKRQEFQVGMWLGNSLPHVLS